MRSDAPLPSRREWNPANGHGNERVSGLEPEALTASETSSAAQTSKSTPRHSDGPVQHGGDNENKNWTSRAGVAKALRWTILVTPSVLSFLATFGLARRYPPYEIGVATVPWWIALFSVGVIVLITSEKLTRRLLPLAALFKLSLVFPDEAPSRFSVAMRTNSTRKLERRLKEVQEHGLPDDTAKHAELMLELVAALSLHDRLTRGHCERVRGYTDMISEEMKLPEEDAAKLRWAALLHDVGKIYVASEILNKKGRPTEDEWDALKSHTWKGDELIEPLCDFLGPWASAVRNHHERWDGNGYPDRLAGTNIPLGARIVAVADAYDVMTSARSYKAPRPAVEARAEIARCAGGQFDPDVARAFLNIGLGRLRFAAGPLSWLANISAVGNAPAIIGTAATQTVLPFIASAAATVIAVGGFPSDAPIELPFEAPSTTIAAPEPTTEPITVEPVTDSEPLGDPVTPRAQRAVIALDEDSATSITLTSNAVGLDTIFILIRGPEHGTLSLPETVASRSASTVAGYTPDPDFNGTDQFQFRVCNADARDRCSDAVVTLQVTPVNDAPVAVDNTISINEDSTLILTPELVLSNDSDVDGDELKVVWTNPAVGTSSLNSGIFSYTPPANSSRDRIIHYRACDDLACTEAVVRVDVIALDDAPVANDDALSTLEDKPLLVSAAWVTRNDNEFDGSRTVVTWVSHPNFDIATSTFTPQPNSTAPSQLRYQLCDENGPLCDTATVNITIVPQEDSPLGTGEAFTLAEDTTFQADLAGLLANDSDPDGDVLTLVWGETSPTGGSLSVSDVTVTYEPSPDFVGTVRIPHQACAGSRCSAQVDVLLNFEAVNDAPRPTSGLTIGGTENTDTNVDFETMLESVTDVDDDKVDLRIEFLGTTPGGFSLQPDETNPTGFTYSPERHSTQDIEIQYRVCDDDDACANEVLVLLFAERDDPPEPAPYAKTINEDKKLLLSGGTFRALAGDPDSPLEELTFSFTQTNPSLGTPIYDPATQLFRYDTNPNQSGQSIVTYTVCDLTTTANCPASTITVKVSPVDDAPTVEVTPLDRLQDEDTIVVFSDADVRALVADVDTNLDELIFNYELAPAGDLTQSGQGFTFTPDPDFVGPVTLTYTVCDTNSCSSDQGEINLEFSAVDDPPSPNDLVIPAVDEDPPGPVVITRSQLVTAANDPDTSDSGLTFMAASPSIDLGTLVQQPDDSWHFIPHLNANGITTYPFQVCDSRTPSPNCSLFDVTFEINPVNDKPKITILTTTFPGTEDVATVVSSATITSLNLFSDPDSPSSQLELFISDPESGLAVDADNQGFTYAPIPESNADVVLDYTVCDADGACSDETGQIVLTFQSVDDPPQAGDLVIGPIDEDPAGPYSLSRSSLEANSTDPDTALSLVTYEVVGYAGDDLGSWSDPGDGGLEFSAYANANGTARYEVDICDNTSCDQFYIDVTINLVNDAPIITSNPSPVSTRFAPPVDVVLPTDYVLVDPDSGDTYTLNPSGVGVGRGSLNFDVGSDQWIFTPNPNWPGSEVTIPFEVCDAAGSCADSEWIVNVIPNSAPGFSSITIDKQFINATNNAVAFTVTDADGDPVSITGDTLPAGLNISGSNGSYTIDGTPTDPGDLGQTVSYTISASDGYATTIHNNSIVFSDQGLSPDAGKIIFSEVASDDIRACAGFICEEQMEEAEAVNISGSSVAISGWTLQDHAPGSTPDVNGRVIDLSDNTYGFIQKWPTTVFPNQYVLFSTFGLGGNVTPWDYEGDDLWLIDENGLIVDYVGWQEAASPIITIPDPELGIWDSDRAAMIEIGGKPDPINRTTIALATVSDANTAACWEFTATGNADSGTYVCPAADTTLTIDHPSAQGQFGMRNGTVHSLYYPNWQ